MTIYLLGAFLVSLICGLVFTPVVEADTLPENIWSAVFLMGLLVIYCMGIVDDLLGLNATTKFCIQIATGCLLPFAGLYINNLYGLFGIYEIPYYVGIPLTVFVIVFIDNAINLIDGIDGLSSALTIIALIGFFFCFHSEDLTYYCVLIAALIGVLIPYQYYNVFGSAEKHKKIFMGDSGSLSLGFILGFLAVKLCMDTPRIAYDPNRIVWAWSLLAVPCFDVVRVFFFRILHGRSPFQADKNHIHHKLMACGLSQHQTLITIVAFQLLIIAVNIILAEIVSSTIILAINIAMYVVFNFVTNLISSPKSVLVSETQHITK